MMLEIARMRINKIRNDMRYSQENLNTELGINNKEDSQASLNQIPNWLIK